MSRPKAQGSVAKSQLQLAIALSTSLEESKTRELSKLAEELPADAIEDGAIPHNIKQMQKEFLERLKPVTAGPSKRKRTTSKIPVPVLFTRSSGERIRIITEKVALILIKESTVEFIGLTEEDHSKSYLSCKNITSLWDMSFLEPLFEERHLYYINNLSAFISPADETIGAMPKNLPLPGRFLTPQKRQHIVNTPSNMSQIKDVYECSSARNLVPFYKQAQRAFRDDWLAMLDNAIMSDISIFTKSTPLPAHKLILHARCPIILKDLDDTGSLNWVDITRAAAILFLEFIYTGQLSEIQPRSDLTEEVVQLASRYRVYDLFPLCHVQGGSDDVLNGCSQVKCERPCSLIPSVHLLSPIPSDNSSKVLDPIEISSDGTTSLENTSKRKEKLGPLFSSMSGDSPNTPDKSKQTLQDESATRKLATNEFCIVISDEENILSPFKCTAWDLSISDPVPFTPPRQWDDDQDTPLPGSKESMLILCPKSDDSPFLPDNSKRDHQAATFLESKRRMLQFSPIPDDSPTLIYHSKRKIPDKNTTRNVVTKKLCTEASAKQYILSPAKCSLKDANYWELPAISPGEHLSKSIDRNACRSSDSETEMISSAECTTPRYANISELSDSNPAKPGGQQLSGNRVSPLNDWNAFLSLESESEMPLRVDPNLETCEKSDKYSPLKESKSTSNIHSQERNFDLKTPTQMQSECATPNRTPLTDIKMSSPATPMPDYWTMTSEELQAELCRYGLKRSLPIMKGIKMLQHIYEKLHPLVKVVVKGGRELFIPIGDKGPASCSDLPASNSLPVLLPTKVDTPPEPPDDDHLLSDSSSDESDMMEESIFADEDNAGYEGLTDLKTTILGWISSNQDLYDKVLRYEPIWLESFHNELKEYTHQNIKLSHLMNILDEEGVTFRMAQKSTKRGRRENQGSKKSKHVCGEHAFQPKELTSFQTSEEFEET